MRRHLIATAVLLGGFALAACGSGGPGVQARQAGDTTTTTAADTTTTTAAEPTTTESPPTTAAPSTAAPTTAPAELPCTTEALAGAYGAAYGGLSGATLTVQKCVQGWATSSQSKGFDPPTFTLYRADGDHWVAVNRSAGKLCAGHGVPPEVAPLIGCDT